MQFVFPGSSSKGCLNFSRHESSNTATAEYVSGLFCDFSFIIGKIKTRFMHSAGAELHCGYGGKDTAVSERAQAMPGVGP